MSDLIALDEADGGGEGILATMRHGLDAFSYNESPAESDEERAKAIVDLLGYNYLLEDQLKKRLTIFPTEKVGRGMYGKEIQHRHRYHM